MADIVIPALDELNWGPPVQEAIAKVNELNRRVQVGPTSEFAAGQQAIWFQTDPDTGELVDILYFDGNP